MISLSPTLSSIPFETLDVYLARDQSLENLPILIFYGFSTVGNSTQNSSRIQVHVFSLAGFQSFPRLTIAPTSPLYAAVDHLPYEQQGDEIRRGLAIGLLSYFNALPRGIKEGIRNRCVVARFDPNHAGELASRVVKLDSSAYHASYVRQALKPQCVSWVDIDVVVESSHSSDDGSSYGKYSPFIESLGPPAFLPTSSLKRAPSRPKAHNGQSSMTAQSKIALREEMNQLLDTERSYINKIGELVRGLESVQHPPAYSTHGMAVSKNLRRIFDVNSVFFNRLDATLEQTENEAIKDIESQTEVSSAIDRTGALAFAGMLLQSVPDFEGPYQDYLRESNDASSIVSRLVSIAGPISDMIVAFGEQKLRSVLIEPVQRLPRYGLIIDNMVNLLPAWHPAVSALLKAKDVLADICSLDTDAASSSETLKRIQKLVAFWPAECKPSGRLISASDAIQLMPPFSQENNGRIGILLLFPTAIVFVEKQPESAMSARGFVAEIDKPSKSTPSLEVRATQPKDLEFSISWPLSDVFLTQSEDASQIRIIDNGQIGSAPMTFGFIGSYEGKVHRFVEEVMKARIEGRFPESIRESTNWALRSANPSADSLGVLAAIFNLDAIRALDDSVSLKIHPHLMILVGDLPDQAVAAHRSSFTEVVHVCMLEDGIYQLSCNATYGIAFVERASVDAVATVLLRRIAQMFKRLSEPQDAGSTSISHQFAFNRSILKALRMEKDESARMKPHRPISPVKMLSNMIEKGLSNPPSPSKRHRPGASSASSIPDLQPSVNRRPPSNDAEPDKHGSAGSLGNLFKASTSDVKDGSASSKTSFLRSNTSEVKDGSASSKVSLIKATAVDSTNALSSLETTFNAYIDALRARCGNIAAKSLQSRGAADELAVNELYNILIEDPTRAGAATMVSAEILFSAFEKFLNHAWKDSLGPLLSPLMLETIQCEFDSGRPAEFRRCFKSTLDDMMPQNRRALCALIKLLWDLLDASGNDGERGVLTASFTEAIIGHADIHKYINLLDRLVEDYEDLFSDLPSDSSRPTTSNGSTFNSFGRNRTKDNDGSLTSNTSSFRRRFGLGLGMLTRENSQSESPSKAASVWRALRKNSRSPGGNRSQPSSISKGSLVRSLSTDTKVCTPLELHASSPSIPTTPGSSGPRDLPNRPSISHLQDPSTPLSTIKEALSKPSTSVKRNRRSSLSDLNDTAIPSPTLAWSPSVSRGPNIYLRNVNTLRGSPQASIAATATNNASAQASTKSSPLTSRPGTGNATKQLSTSSVSRFGSPLRTTSPSRKENMPIRLTSPDREDDSPKPSRIAVPKSSTRMASPQFKSSSPSSKTSPDVKTATKNRTTLSPRKGLAERQRPSNAQSQFPPPKSLHSTESSTTSLFGSPHKVPPATSPPPLNIRKLPSAQSPPRLKPTSTDPFTATTSTKPTSPTATTTAESPRKLKLRSPSKLRARLSAEHRALAAESTDLAAEMQAIGLEISASSSAAKINLSTATDLQFRLKTLEDRFSSTSASLTCSIDDAKRDISESLRASGKRVKKLEKLYGVVNAENEALYERFNEELGKILGKVKGGEGMAEMRKRIKELEGECEGLRRENGRLKLGGS